MKILIVDDKEENLYLLESLLKGCGYEVVSAVNGQVALEQLRDDSFNMIISDILMPVMDGYSLLKKVRADDKHKDIPFVFYTATYTDAQDEELALKLGVDKYIRKPLDPEEFLNIMVGVIRDAERGKKRPPKPALKEEKEVLKLYSERLVKMLEKKMLALEKEVAERKRAQEALLESRNRVRAIVDTAVEGIITIDGHGIIESFNKAAEHLFGYTKKEAIGKNVKILMPDPYHSEHDDYLAHYHETGEKKIIGIGREVVGKRKNGIIFPMNLAISELHIKDQLIYIGIVHDISKRKLAEEKLRSSQKYSQNLIDSSLDMIIAVDKRRRITEFNRAAEATFGYEKHEVLGKHVNLLYANVEEGRWVHRQTLESGQLVQEILNKRKNGETFPALLAASTLLDKRGEVAGVMGVSRDISEQIRARKELEDALDKAQEGEKMKSLFLANMSHEIRTPLNSIMGFTELIESRVEQHISAEDKSLFEIIRNSGERLMRTVHEILDISQIEAGTFKVVRHPLNLNAVITQVQNELQSLAEEKSLELTYKCDDADIQITGDEYCITQAISNLVDNALKYTKIGKVDISLLRKNGDILLTIQDTGIGISKEYQERMFTVFSQESEGYTKDYQGIGLGLALTKGYLDLNSVNIDVRSRKGSGTTITLTFQEIKQDRKRSAKAKQRNKA